MTLVFSKVAGLPSEGNAPYAILVFAGMLPWQLFSGVLGTAGNSLVNSPHLISKVYFPRLIIPGAAVAVSLSDSLISFGALGALMAWYQYVPSIKILLLPVLLLLTTLTALGPGLLLSSLNIKYRDFRFIIPFAIQFGLYLSPVGFSSQVVRAKFGETLFSLYCLNPMVGIIEAFRWCILKDIRFPTTEILVSSAITMVLMLISIRIFRATERTFADVI